MASRHVNSAAVGIGGRHGFAMGAVLIVLIVTIVFGFGYLALAYHEANLGAKEVQSSAAFYVAEAGVQRTLYLLSVTEDWTALSSTLFEDEPLVDVGTYTVELRDRAEKTLKIHAKGTVLNQSRILEMSVSKP